MTNNKDEIQDDNEYKDFLRVFIVAIDRNQLPPIHEIPTDELELLEVIVPDLLEQMVLSDNPAFKTERAEKIRGNLLEWWNEESLP